LLLLAIESCHSRSFLDKLTNRSVQLKNPFRQGTPVMTATRRNLAVVAGVLFLLALIQGWESAPKILNSVMPSTRLKKLQNNGYTETLELNPNCTMFPDIVGIYHDAASCSVRVVVQSNATEYDNATNSSRKPCLRPYLVGRLSGPTVGIVSPWIYLPKGNGSMVIEGNYEVPVSGTYFLEIIVILCNNYNEEILRQAQNVTTPGTDWTNDAAFQGEMKHVLENCVEHPERHRLTARNVSIQVTQETSRSKVASDSNDPLLEPEKQASSVERLSGFWEWNTSSNQRMEPLYTRYQPLPCTDLPECLEPEATLERFSPYRFVWTTNVNLTEEMHTNEQIDPARVVPRHFVDEETLRKLIWIRSQTRVNDTICLLGASHSREMVELLKVLMQIPVFWVETHRAGDLGEDLATANQVQQFIVGHSHGSNPQCTILVIGLGSWVSGENALGDG
jgi:hypothetical protein